MSQKTIIGASVASAVLASSLLMSTPALANKKVEKCFGIAKEGMNDCAANGHSCAGYAEFNNDPTEWIYVPAGTCATIVNMCKEEDKKLFVFRDRELSNVCSKVAKQKKGVTGGKSA